MKKEVMLNRDEIFKYADQYGKASAARLLRRAGEDKYEGIDYDELLAYLEMRDIPRDDEPEYLTDEPGFSRNYGPSNPWDAPGMSVSDFIR